MNWLTWVGVLWACAVALLVVWILGASRKRGQTRLYEIDADRLIVSAVGDPGRPDWDEYFLLIAQAVATRGECTRSQVGAVIVRDNRILATGYNGVEAGAPSCLDGICPRAQNNVPKGSLYVGGGYCIATHAEENAILDAKRRGIDLTGAQMYLTKEPCERCEALLLVAGLTATWPLTSTNAKKLRNPAE